MQVCKVCFDVFRACYKTWKMGALVAEVRTKPAFQRTFLETREKYINRKKHGGKRARVFLGRQCQVGQPTPVRLFLVGRGVALLLAVMLTV